MSPAKLIQTTEEAAQALHVVLDARKLIPKPRGLLKPVGLPWPLQIAGKEEEFIEALYELRIAEDELANSENTLMVDSKRASVRSIKKEIVEIQMEILGYSSDLSSQQRNPCKRPL